MNQTPNEPTAPNPAIVSRSQAEPHWRGVAHPGLGRLSARMQACSFIILIVLVLVGCGHRDPIDRIVKEESRNPYFHNGMFTAIRLPPTASAIEVALKALGQSDTNIAVLESRQVQIHADKELPPELMSYTAVLIDTGKGRKVVLLQFQKYSKDPPGAWWSRVYEL